MIKTSTQNHILQSIYGELDECSDYKIKKETLDNQAFGEEYRELKKVVSLLNSLEMSPKSSTVKSILRASKNQEELV